jgi:hypothetical protein
MGVILTNMAYFFLNLACSGTMVAIGFLLLIK